MLEITLQAGLMSGAYLPSMDDFGELERLRPVPATMPLAPWRRPWISFPDWWLGPRPIGGPGALQPTASRAVSWEQTVLCGFGSSGDCQEACEDV